PGPRRRRLEHRPMSMSTDAKQPTSLILALNNQPIWRQVLVLGWPALVQQFLILLVILYDAWLAGRYAPEHGEHVAAQSAQTTALYLSWLVSCYALLVSVGSTALV